MDLIIRSETNSDVNDIYEIITLAFSRESEAKLVDKLRETNNLLLSLLCSANGKSVAHIGFSPVSLNGYSSEFQCLGLAPLAVIPEYQNKGIGSRLVGESLNQLKALKIDVVFVLGNPVFYSRFGFQLSRKNFGITSKYSDNHFMALPMSDKFLHTFSESSVITTAHYSEPFDQI